ncbi:PIR Superfamily Protein [Plasmodium malariae]|uniref:PIR Superfamily Protein n=1 Tax=Plasmodium malariae TaxID=5858 RepID=A0A1A8WVQ9_PLAMA|nr:PIR Superfamily Protein [Plasmodium malariae]
MNNVKDIESEMFSANNSHLITSTSNSSPLSNSLNFQRHHVYSANDYTASNIPNSSNISISNELSLENGNLTFNFFVNYLILLLPLISILLTIPIAKYLYNNTPVGTCYNKTCNYVSGDTNKNEGHFANTNIESPKVITENKTYTEHSSTTQRDTRTVDLIKTHYEEEKRNNDDNNGVSRTHTGISEEEKIESKSSET